MLSGQFKNIGRSLELRLSMSDNDTSDSETRRDTEIAESELFFSSLIASAWPLHGLRRRAFRGLTDRVTILHRALSN